MRAVQLNEYGSADNFANVEVDEPDAGPGEIRVKVAYAGLRWGDVMARNGRPAKIHSLPFIAGQETSGWVDQIGDGVAEFHLGQPVVAFVPKGAYAEFAVAAVDQGWPVWPLSDTVPLDKALAYPTNMITAYLIVFAWAKVQPGDTVLLHAASGGVGLIALQIMKKHIKDVRVIGICSSQSKRQLLLANGCDHVVDRTTHNYVDEVNRICGPKASGFQVGGERGGGVDVSLNGISGSTLELDKLVIRKRGRWVIYGYAGDAAPTPIDTDSITYDGITIMPFSQIAWWGTPEFEEAVQFTQQWLATEELTEPEVWPLDRVADAQRALEAGQTTGKVVFKVAAD